MSKLRCLAALVAGAALTIGCGEDGKYSVEYTKKPQLVEEQKKFAEVSDSFQTIEGKILKVQPSQISFKSKYSENTNGSHEFIYLILEDNDGKMHTLVYPFSHAFLEQRAKLRYRPVPNGELSADDFLRLFIKDDYYSYISFPIKTEGIVAKDGVEYITK